MKRSELDRIVSDGLAFCDRLGFLLPPFARWTARDWQAAGPECKSIVETQLGWDVTDFGSGKFDHIGLLLFTIRNGTFAELSNPLGKWYAEKVLVVRDGQITPAHFHWQKMEDIINRGGGGRLVLRLWNSTADDGLADTEVRVLCDGIERRLSAGGRLELGAGESVTLPQRLYHEFHAEGGPVLVGEVSRVNDDHSDNRFLEAVGRFPTIVEDQPPKHLLMNDYARYYQSTPAAHGQ